MPAPTGTSGPSSSLQAARKRSLSSSSWGAAPRDWGPWNPTGCSPCPARGRRVGALMGWGSLGWDLLGWDLLGWGSLGGTGTTLGEECPGVTNWFSASSTAERKSSSSSSPSVPKSFWKWQDCGEKEEERGWEGHTGRGALGGPGGCAVGRSGAPERPHTAPRGSRISPRHRAGPAEIPVRGPSVGTQIAPRAPQNRLRAPGPVTMAAPRPRPGPGGGSGGAGTRTRGPRGRGGTSPAVTQRGPGPA